MVLNSTLMLVFPLADLVKKVVVSNVPSLKNDLLLRGLRQHQRMVSLMRWIPLGCRSPLLMSFRRQVSMILSDDKEELNLTCHFRVEEFDYTVHVTTDSLKCFG